MAFGVFCDIYQQDGRPQRMYYEGTDINTVSTISWIGVMEETAQNFRRDPLNAGDRSNDRITT